MTSCYLIDHPDYPGKRVYMPAEFLPLHTCGGIPEPYVLNGPFSVDIDTQLRNIYSPASPECREKAMQSLTDADAASI